MMLCGFGMRMSRRGEFFSVVESCSCQERSGGYVVKSRERLSTLII
jgi:hypothetical protein